MCCTNRKNRHGVVSPFFILCRSSSKKNASLSCYVQNYASFICTSKHNITCVERWCIAKKGNLLMVIFYYAKSKNYELKARKIQSLIFLSIQDNNSSGPLFKYSNFCTAKNETRFSNCLIIYYWACLIELSLWLW